jgi:hypothetical protein
MRTRFVSALPILLVLVTASSCKRGSSEAPDDEPPPRKGYGDLMWSESTSIQPLEVCQHLGEVVAAEAGQPGTPIDPNLLANCEADMRIEAGLRGTDGWNAMASCVMNSTTAADIDYCDRTNPLPEQGGGSGGPRNVAVGERELGACDHVIDILMLETAAASGEVPPLTIDERRSLVQECAEALVLEQEPVLSPADYERLLECMETAESSVALRDCG